MKNLGFGIVLLSLFACRPDLEPQWDIPQMGINSRLESVSEGPGGTMFIGGGQRYGETLILQSQDGQDPWEAAETDVNFEAQIFDLAFFPNGIGLAPAMGGALQRSNSLGDRWYNMYLATIHPLRAVEIVNDSVAFVVGGIGYSHGVMLKSQDYGRNWQLVDTFEYELRDIQFTDQQTAFACGYGVVYKSNDAGQSWEFTPASGDFYSALHFPEKQTGYVVGRTGSILKTMDGGDSWIKLRNGNKPWKARHRYNDVQFVDAQTGFIVGDEGLILKTIDGGKKWLKVALDANTDLLDIHLLSSSSGIIVGDAGTLLRFSE